MSQGPVAVHDDRQGINSKASTVTIPVWYSTQATRSPSAARPFPPQALGVCTLPRDVHHAVHDTVQPGPSAPLWSPSAVCLTPQCSRHCRRHPRTGAVTPGHVLRVATCRNFSTSLGLTAAAARFPSRTRSPPSRPRPQGSQACPSSQVASVPAPDCTSTALQLGSASSRLPASPARASLTHAAPTDTGESYTSHAAVTRANAWAAVRAHHAKSWFHTVSRLSPLKNLSVILRVFD